MIDNHVPCNRSLKTNPTLLKIIISASLMIWPSRISFLFQRLKWNQLRKNRLLSGQGIHYWIWKPSLSLSNNNKIYTPVTSIKYLLSTIIKQTKNYSSTTSWTCWFVWVRKKNKTPARVKVKLASLCDDSLLGVFGYRSHLVHGEDVEHRRRLAGRLEQNIS